MSDLSGMKFGSYSVIDKDQSRSGFWHCVCSCGKKKSVSGSQLRNGHTKQCSECRVRTAVQYRKHYNFGSLTGILYKNNRVSNG